MATPTAEPPCREDNCPVCIAPFGNNSAIRLACGHCFHDSCGQNWVKTKQPSTCPLCRDPFDISFYYDSDGKAVEEPASWAALWQEVAEDSSNETGIPVELANAFMDFFIIVRMMAESVHRDSEDVGIPTRSYVHQRRRRRRAAMEDSETSADDRGRPPKRQCRGKENVPP